MKFKESILSSILASIMVFSTVSSTLVFADTIDYKSSLTKLQQMGIIDSSITDVSSLVTRGQLIKTIAIADGLATTASSSNGSTIFPDVDSQSELSGYVNAVINAGTSTSSNVTFMSGMPDGNFHAEQGISYAQACTILVRLLGYKDSDLGGSWPNNYIQQASTLKLTTDINLKRNDKLTVGMEALLFDRLLNTLVKGSTSKYFSDQYFSDQYVASNITGTLVERTILGNSKTTDALSDNQVLTDKGTYTVQSGAGTLELGLKYKLYLDNTTITKVSVKENSAENYAVTKVDGTTISYSNDKDVVKTMTLPQASAYYYHGVFTNYEVAVKDIQAHSSIILTKNNDNSGYDYGVIIDPYFSSPQIYKFDNTKLIDQIKSTNYSYIYRGSNISLTDLNAEDVVYFVSDIWSKNTFIYVNNITIYGRITSILPNKISPTSMVISNVTYTFSPYFDKTRLNNYDGSIENFIKNTNVNDYRTLILGVDGKIVDIY